MKQRKTGVQFFTGFVALAATAAAMFRGTRAAASRAGDENTAALLDAQYQEAVKKNNAATPGRILADDCVLVTGNGRKQRKPDLLKESSSGAITYEHQEDTRIALSVCGTTRSGYGALGGKRRAEREQLRLQIVVQRHLCAQAFGMALRVWVSLLAAGGHAVSRQASRSDA